MDKEGWQEQAYAAVRKFAIGHFRLACDGFYDRNHAVTVEVFRAWAYRHNLCDMPGDERWWGPVVQRALREKIIRRKGFGPAKSSHGALKARYVGTRFA